MSGKSKYLAALALVGGGFLPVLATPVHAAEVTCDGSEISQVGTVCYDDLASAIAAAADGGTIILKNNQTENVVFPVGKTLTFDLGGYTLTGQVVVEGTADISNGTLINNTNTVKVDNGTAALGNGDSLTIKATDGNAVRVINSSTVNIYSGAYITGAYGVVLMPEANANSSTVNIYGGEIKATTNGADGGVGIFVHGNIKTGSGPTINISGGTITAVHGSTGDVSDDDAQGIAQNGLSTINISGGTITGDEAIGVKAGTLKVTGGTLNGTGAYHDPATANFDGTEATGAAISITSNSSYADINTVTIEGGTISSTNGYAVYEGISSGTSKLSDGDLVITGGTLVADKGAVKATTISAGAGLPADKDLFLVNGEYILLPIPTAAGASDSISVYETEYFYVAGLGAGVVQGASDDNSIVEAIGYDSSDDEYRLHAKASGTATITLTATGVKGTYTRTYNVTVAPVEEIVSVEIKIDEPKIGMTVAEVNATLVTDDTYVQYGTAISWFVYDEEANDYGYPYDGELSDDYVFEAGKRYFMELRFWPKTGYALSENTKFIFNGEELEILDSWYDVVDDWNILRTSIDLYDEGTVYSYAYLEYVLDLKAPNTGVMTAEGGSADADNTMAVLAAVVAGFALVGLAVKAKRN